MMGVPVDFLEAVKRCEQARKLLTDAVDYWRERIKVEARAERDGTPSDYDTHEVAAWLFGEFFPEAMKITGHRVEEDEEDEEDAEDKGEANEPDAMFVNFYKCPRCSYEWEDSWSCRCNDRCPSCALGDVEPYESEDA